MDIIRKESDALRIWNQIRHFMAGMLVIGFITFMVFAMINADRGHSARNSVDQRNHRRDTMECETKGGLMGQGTCFDVDSIIHLVGGREEYK